MGDRETVDAELRQPLAEVDRLAVLGFAVADVVEEDVLHRIFVICLAVEQAHSVAWSVSVGVGEWGKVVIPASLKAQVSCAVPKLPRW